MISYDSSLDKIQNCCFEYLLFYYLNEQYSDNQNGRIYQNFAEIFREIKDNNKVYKYKEKYIKPLYSDTFIKSKQNIEGILLMKLSILLYLAKTNQISGFENCQELIKIVSSIKQSKKQILLSTMMF